MKSLNVNNVSRTPIDQIKPNPRNAREHSSEQVAQIARSIEEFGFTSPILTDETGMILAGHGKWLAAQKALHDRSAGARPGRADRNREAPLLDCRQSDRPQLDLGSGTIA